MARQKVTHTNRKSVKWKPGKVMAVPSSPAGKMKTKKGKTANLGFPDPVAPSWRTPPFVGTFKL